MASAKFTVKTHVFEGQHIRHYPGATRNGDSDIQYLEAKQYIPLNSPHPPDSAVTIIGAHATGFPKELYEPVWEGLLAQSEHAGFRIGSIWIADGSTQGESGVLNEKTQGDDPSWSDHARDILHMTNVFRQHMKQPIVAIGHSMGATTLIETSLMHPRLFASLVLVDPIIGTDTMSMGQSLIYMASVKPDIWPSRESAAKIFRKVFKHWDPRTFELWMKHAFRETPTLLYPEPGNVTLRTTRAQESWLLGRPQFESPAEDGSLTKSGRIKYPDADTQHRPMYQSVIEGMYEALPRLRPDVLYVVPQRSTISEQTQQATLSRVGTATGGSGGVKEGRATKATVKAASHLCMFERPDECARIMSGWLSLNLQDWRERVEYERKNRDDKSTADKLRISQEWVRQAKVLREKDIAAHGKPKM